MWSSSISTTDDTEITLCYLYPDCLHIGFHGTPLVLLTMLFIRVVPLVSSEIESLDLPVLIDATNPGDLWRARLCCPLRYRSGRSSLHSPQLEGPDPTSLNPPVS